MVLELGYCGRSDGLGGGELGRGWEREGMKGMVILGRMSMKMLRERIGMRELSGFLERILGERYASGAHARSLTTTLFCRRLVLSSFTTPRPF